MGRKPTKISLDPVVSNLFRLMDSTAGTHRIRDPTTSCRNPVPGNPTPSDGILSEHVGFLSETIGLSWIPSRILPDPRVGFLVLG